MRTKEEIMDMVMQIDNGKDAVKEKDDIQYLEDAKAALQWVLKKISSGQEVSKIEEEMGKIMDIPVRKLMNEELEGEERNALTDLLNREFEGFNITDYRRLESAGLNVSDAWDWILERTTTKEFLIDYLMFETAGLFYRGEPVR